MMVDAALRGEINDLYKKLEHTSDRNEIMGRIRRVSKMRRDYRLSVERGVLSGNCLRRGRMMGFPF